MSKPVVQPKYETILTRHKTAQMKRQLRNKDRSMTHITQLLMKGPPKSTKTSPKKVKNDKIQRVRNVSENCNNEYHPTKLKRHVKRKKIILKPKQEFKMIASAKVNKRKLGVPLKGSFNQLNHSQEFEQQKICKSQSTTAQLSMAEAIQISEDTQGLDDEDLMEILTCPSPVWWEDPPDTGYSEDPVFTKVYSVSEDCDILKSYERNTKQENENDKIAIENIKVPSKTTKDDKFMKKRNKLEHLLGNIRNKISNKLNIEMNNERHNVPSVTEDSESPNTKKSKRRVSESTETDGFSEGSIMDDEMLKDLESMEIPIEEKEIKTESEKTSQLPNDRETNNKNKLDADDILHSCLKRIKPEEMPEMPPLKKRPHVRKTSSPLSNKSYEPESKLSRCQSGDNLYSISDTNIRFLEDCDSCEVDKDFRNNFTDKTYNSTSYLDGNRVDDDKIKQEVIDDECVTVYKIISEEKCNKSKAIKTRNFKMDDVKRDTKLNTYFKKCKHGNRSPKQKSRENLNDKIVNNVVTDNKSSKLSS